MPRPRQRSLLLILLLLLPFLLLSLAQAWTPPSPTAAAPTTRQGALTNHLGKATALLGLLSLSTPKPALAVNAPQNPSPAAIFILGGYRIPADQYTSYQRRLLADIPSLESVTLLPDRQGEADEIDSILQQLQQSIFSNKQKKKKVVLIGHSRGASVAVRVAARLPSFSSRLDLCGLILLDPVDEQDKSSISSSSSSSSSRSSSSSSNNNSSSTPSSASTSSSSCLPLLRSLPPTLPIVILALPFSGVNAYYKSPNRNVCAPPGRDARAFYATATAGAGAGADGRSLPLLLTLPSAGHLQLLDARLSLPFAEMCGVGKTNTDQEIQAFVAAVVVACCEGWIEGEGGREGGLRERIWRRVEEEGGGMGGGMGGSAVWEGGGEGGG